MAILHTVNKSPFERNTLEACLQRASEGDAVLLIEDGVYAATSGKASDAVNSASGVKFFALGPDLKARGVKEDSLIEGVQVVDFGGFVDLATQYDKVSAWL